MTRKQANVLLAACAWTAFVWGVAVKNLVINAHSTGFRVVHGILAAVSLGFGAFIGKLGWRARKTASREP